MKMKKKAALAAVLFSAALNTACNLYGPPESEFEEWELEENDTEIVINDDTTQSEEETSPDTSEETEGDEQQ